MEKKVTYLGEHLPPIRLFPSDVKELYNILYSSDKDVSIETKDFVLNSLEELFSLEMDKINQLRFLIHKPYVSIDLGESRIWLFTSQDDHLSRGIFSEL